MRSRTLKGNSEKILEYHDLMEVIALSLQADLQNWFRVFNSTFEV